MAVGEKIHPLLALCATVLLICFVLETGKNTKKRKGEA